MLLSDHNLVHKRSDIATTWINSTHRATLFPMTPYLALDKPPTPSGPAIQRELVQDDGRVFIDMPDNASNPCSTCGACCSHFRVSFYAGESDVHEHGHVPSAMVTQIGPMRACMSGTEQGGRCSALMGTIGAGPISCSIYAQRPSPCREYPVWLADGTPNPSCQRLRANIGLAPLPHQQRDGEEAIATLD
jgi:Fe-S-cluster containining protein